MSETIFRKVLCSERLPEKEGNYITNVHSNKFYCLKDSIYYHANVWWDVVWWLEEIEINTIKAEAWDEGFNADFNYNFGTGEEPFNPYKP